MARPRDVAQYGAKEMLIVDYGQIEVMEGFNVRVIDDQFNEGIEHLEASIIENGLRKPIECYLDGEKFKLVDGHRRYAAIGRAIANGHEELRRVPCLLRDAYKNEVERIIALAVSNDGQPLSPLEKSEIIKRLLNYNLSIAEIAKKLGLSYAYVQGLTELVSAPEEVKSLVRDGTIKSTTAINVLRESETHDEAVSVLQLAVEEAKAEHATKDDDEQTEAGEEDSQESAELPLSEGEQPAKQGRGRPKGSKNKEKKVRVTGAKVKKIQAQLRGENTETPTQAGFSVTPETIQAVSDDELRSFFIEIADFKFVEGQDAWGLEDIIKGWVEKAQKLVGVPEGV